MSNNELANSTTRKPEEFDHYAEDYKYLVSQSTGDKVEDIEFYAFQKIRILKKILGPREIPANILDYGCGIGLSLSPMRKAFPTSQLYASDPSEKSLNMATRGGMAIPIPFSELAVLRNKDKFDLIFVSCVFHHINASEHLSTLSTLLKNAAPNGKLIIVEHNPWNPVTQKIVNNCPFDEGVTLISGPSMKKRMRISGWKKPRVRFISFVPAKLRQLGWIDEYFGWCPLGGQYIAYGTRG